MGDYSLTGLNPRDFEHLVQALAKKHIATGVTPFGDGPDGGREATYEGKMDYPSDVDPWEGYLVIQCKLRKSPTSDTTKDGKWAIDQLKGDLKKFADTKRNLRTPDYYLFVTNLKLSAVPETGSKDRARATLEDFKSQLSLKGYDIWSYDELCRFIDDNLEIRKAYAGFITTGDILSEMMCLIQMQKPDFLTIMTTFLQKQLLHDQAARLDSAGQVMDQQIQLARVFVDLPVTSDVEKAHEPLETNGNLGEHGLVTQLLKHGSEVLRNATRGSLTAARQDPTTEELRHPRVVVVGGPGQGKSTLGQYLCQLYRTAILRVRPSDMLDDAVTSVIRTVEESLHLEKKDFPTTHRFPIRIPLSRYASELAGDDKLTILEYIRREISHYGSAECSLSDLLRWLGCFPWFVVLDGLDEVPPSSNRREVLRMISDFRVDAASVNSDLLILASTRPQNYSDEFPSDLYRHVYLTPLSRQQALAYGQKLIEVQYGQDQPDYNTVARRLHKACVTEATARLMQSPLQVTIMTALLRRTGDPPRQRYRLFKEYYRTIYEREISKGGPVSEMLNDRKTDIDSIHYRTGLLVQTDSERVGQTEACISDDRFRALVRARLSEVGVVSQEADILLDQIADSSLQRLVFLVRPSAEQVAFEIRSMQEFMAAEALFRGPEDAVVSRLKAIAPISHWRNVFLFAVGKCFAEQEHLLDHIYTVCNELNNRNADPVLDATLWGSRSALDILSEGVARQNPKYESLFANLALQLLRVPDHGLHVKLAEVHNSYLSELYKKAVLDCLAHRSYREHQGAWTVVIMLSDRGVSWASQVTAERWQDYAPTERKAFVLATDYPTTSSAVDRLLDVLPYCTDREVLNFMLPYRYREADRSLLPDWMQAWLAFWASDLTELVTVRFSGTHRTELTLTTIKASLSAYREAAAPVHLAPEIKALATIRSAVRFTESPSGSTLAKELRSFCQDWDRSYYKDYYFFNSILPWPLSACLNAAETEADLLRLAEQAASGRLGSIEQWTAAENRWQLAGITESDFQVMTDDRWPFDEHIATSGFPFPCSWPNPRVDGLTDFLEYGVSLCSKLDDGRLRTWAASMFLLAAVWAWGIQPKPRIQAEPELLRDIISTGAQALRWPTLHFLDVLKLPDRLDQNWIDFFDWLGKQAFTSSGGFLGSKLHSEQLSHYFATSPHTHRGLLNILRAMVPPSDNYPIPVSLLDYDAYEVENEKESAAILRLSQGNWSDTESTDLARYLTGLSLKRLILIRESLGVLERFRIAPERVAVFALDLLRCVRELDDDVHLEEHMIIDALVEVMNVRQSVLGDSDSWKNLKLPDLA